MKKGNSALAVIALAILLIGGFSGSGITRNFSETTWRRRLYPDSPFRKYGFILDSHCSLY